MTISPPISRTPASSDPPDRSICGKHSARIADRGRLKQVFLVHGAPARLDALKEALEREGYPGVTIPERGDSAHL